ncbi:MAG TPA: ABC transporter [Porphyromonadaceae bacterium]|jgi:ABC-type multidrug transport system fused ATPase/permease subunit|nr:ABC transporter [Porphyromonadaceae bacterium]HBX21138.1 ABC transporter [Porphyromonadaceae bacterium]HCM21593.1 ABC transporter [Porphyromonadaceae bacterium]
MTLRQLFKQLRPYVKPYHWLVFFTLVLTAIGSFTAQVNAFVLRYTVDQIAILLEQHKGLKEGLSILITISLILIMKEIVNAFIQFGQKYYGEKLRIFISKDLAQTVIEKVLTFKMAFFTSEGNQPGKLQTRIDRGVENLTRLVQNFFIDILPLFANALVALVMMFNANFYVGMVGLCIMPVYFFISIRQAKRMSGARRQIQELRENKSQGILSILESITVIKSFVREDIEAKKQLMLQNNLTDTQMRIRSISFLFDGVKSFVEQIGIVIIIILTAYLVLTGQMTIGAIMFHIMLFNNVSAPIRQLHRIYDQMNDALIYSESFFNVLNAEHETEATGDYQSPKVSGKFELKDVSFTYPDNKETTLFNINMRIFPGKSTALVGLSGAGKSTLINLLDKFYQPDSGTILLDGVSLQNYDTDFLRDHIGLVLQKNHIFNGSIEENIRYGKPDATHDEIMQAAKKAYLHDQIMSLSKGYDSPAMLLSGGQQQKIAIARMFLKNPPIIFLDEPTASLDAISTEQIKNSIDAIKKDRTVITISHSISQIIDADMIYVMKNGRIVESGTHEQIYRLNGTYKEIFDAMARSLNIEKISETFD